MSNQEYNCELVEELLLALALWSCPKIFKKFPKKFQKMHYLNITELKILKKHILKKYM